SGSFAPIEQDEKGILWHTWAGGRVNNTLRYAFKVELGTIGVGSGIEVQATNETVRIVGESASWNDFCQILEKMEAPGYWHKPELLDAIIAMLPDWRLSKFQPYLPENQRRQLVADQVLDLEGVEGFLALYNFATAASRA
ncbi:MAG: hypothetical protein JXM71_02915, partial [Spirochaetales bacterium]|nr:hypothetical protein [Spirochaetales bacterium]